MLKLIIFLRPFAWYFLIAWVLTIVTFSSLPNIPTLKIHTARAEFRLDYLMHICEYSVLTFITFLLFARNDFRINYKKYILVTLSLIMFAVLDELHQKFIPGRSYNIMDILSNIGGILVAVIFCIIVFRKIARRIRNEGIQSIPEGLHQ